ncbi:dehydrogenase [Virgisporangium aliadipatigenens]|uniref:Dehydrogenase n=1 Tax=Virgisporangium aliadipatigenens TaxID=741659 RepID=A0A8J3YNG5_9ACTN|nr:SDR family oxidoreductase [Virgisporangium aliadipatigenens]GIJ46898.1 dehydrogenase [Virgisporangium aliadipatigenens]
MMSPLGLELRDAVVVVTGGGSGIGAALARRYAAEGATVVVNDLDPDAARSVAVETGGTAFPGDVSQVELVNALVEHAWERHGGLDIFCANAGIAPRGDAAAPDAVWEQAWQVNVMAHVYAARALLPRWLADGQGRFVATVSAAGLLTLLGKAPYAVTKHAALSFAEWLRASYEHRGITVQALCPQGVRTPMLAAAAPDSPSALLNDNALAPEEVAGCVIEAMRDDRFLILPHPEVAEYYRRRATDPDRWLTGMNRLQQKVESGPATL